MRREDADNARYAASPQTAVTGTSREVHPLVLAAGAGCYVWILGVFAVVLGRTPEAVFMIAVAALFLAVYLAVPGLLAAVRGAGESPGPTLTTFLRRPLELWTGEVRGRDAAIQVVLVPLCLAAGITVMGIVIAWARASVTG